MGQGLQGSDFAAVAKGRKSSVGEPEWGERGEAGEMVCQDELGFTATHDASGESAVFVIYERITKEQIRPDTNSVSNSRTMRESTSLQLEGVRGIEDGLDTDQFYGFSSMTLRHDDDDDDEY